MNGETAAENPACPGNINSFALTLSFNHSFFHSSIHIFSGCNIDFLILLHGNYYCYDLPGALNKPLRERLGLSQEAFVYPLNLLYAVYSVPNTVLPLVGGWLLDRFGVRRILHVLAALVCVGQAVFALGIERASIAVMLVGRLLFG